MLVTLKDIAREAGVSVSTVSRVLNKKSKTARISPETEALIMKAAKKLKYNPNQLARSLRLKKTHTIGLVVPDISNPFFAFVTRVIQKHAYDAGYSLVVCNTDEDLNTETEQVLLLRGKGVDGFIIMPVGLDQNHIRELLEYNKPLVLLDRCFDSIDANSVGVDNYTGAFMGTEHLIKNGHEEIAIIQGLPNTSTNSSRVRGYRDALLRYDIPVRDENIVGNDFRKDNGYIETKLLLGRHKPPTALFTMSDLITLGALEAIYESGLSIPEDISIISFDEVDFAPFLKAPLTVVRQPRELLGQAAVKLLIDDIRFKGDKPKQKVELKTELIVRESVRDLKSYTSKMARVKV